MGMDMSFAGKEGFTKKVRELRLSGLKVKLIPDASPYRKAVYVDGGRVMIVEEWCAERVSSDDWIHEVLDTIVYERGQRPALETMTRSDYEWSCYFCGLPLSPEEVDAESRRQCKRLHRELRAQHRLERQQYWAQWREAWSEAKNKNSGRI